MTRARLWAPLLLCLLPSVPGRPRLPPPQNLTWLFRNFSVYLTWLPGPGYPEDVTYSVNFRRSLMPKRWQRVENCTRIRELECSLMCLQKLDLYNKFTARVLAASLSSKSPWVESEPLEYLYDVEPAPPVLTVTQTEDLLSVNATYHVPHCMTPWNLNYQVAFWKEGTMDKTLFPEVPQDQTVPIPLVPELSGRYCLSARSIHTIMTTKYSEFSTPTCFSLEAPGASWAVLVLFLLPVLVVIATGYMVWRSLTQNPWFQRTKLPDALDFSGHRPPVATLPTRHLESLDNLTFCPRKELIRRVRRTPQVRTPAIVQAGAEEERDEEEEEEEDDDDDAGDKLTFQPYIEPPPLQRWKQQVLSHSETGSPGTPQIQVRESSAWDSSGQSWTSSVDSPWDQSGSSGYLAKKGRGHRLGGDQYGNRLPLVEVSEDSGSVVEFSKDSLSWAHWDAPSPRHSLAPGGPQICLQTLTICLDSDPEEDEEGEQEWQGGSSDTEDSGAGSWEAESFLETRGKAQAPGHYMAR